MSAVPEREAAQWVDAELEYMKQASQARIDKLDDTIQTLRRAEAEFVRKLAELPDYPAAALELERQHAAHVCKELDRVKAELDLLFTPELALLCS